jgi:hypothetical protein
LTEIITIQEPQYTKVNVTAQDGTIIQVNEQGQTIITAETAEELKLELTTEEQINVEVNGAFGIMVQMDSVFYEASININSHTPVALINNKLEPYDCTNPLHQYTFVGFTKTSVLANQNVQIEEKKIELTGWNLMPNKNYLAGQNGQLITDNNIPNSFVKIIGFSENSDTLLIYKNYDSILINN